MLEFLVITIPWSPNLGQIGPFLITWHGLFTALGILGGVQLSLWAGRRVGYDEDDAYTLALVGVPSGIIGARALFVAEHWAYYGQNPADIFAIAEGGISVWGAVLGGVLGSFLFAMWRGYELRKGLDIASFGLITGMGIGRLGDLVNGEHLAKATTLPWAVIYSHPQSPAFAHSLTVGAHHPATTYEMIGDFVILGALFFFMFGPLRRRPGLTFFVFLISYSVMRWAVSFLRMDSADTFLPGATVPQLVSILTVIGSIPPVIWLLRQPPVDPAPAPARPGRIPVRRE
ncbi:MAG: prolipoprotein diacylglyceryl transferase [Chloroflexi bacterium]|nr:prolipoprotein diacylglyceryl transferase [Chloroflexota bacterium]